MGTPNDIYAEYSKNATSRTKRSLTIIHEVCREQHELHKSNDFSVATIGKIVHQRGGPSERAIRNKQGSKYKALIATWARHVGGNETKKAMPNLTAIEQALSTISDPGLKAIALSLASENKKLLRQVHLQRKELESTTIVDLRPRENESGPVLSISKSLRLSEHEINALHSSLSEDLLNNEGWELEPSGRIVTESGRTLYPPGYTSALKKILKSL